MEISEPNLIFLNLIFRLISNLDRFNIKKFAVRNRTVISKLDFTKGMIQLVDRVPFGLLRVGSSTQVCNHNDGFLSPFGFSSQIFFLKFLVQIQVEQYFQVRVKFGTYWYL